MNKKYRLDSFMLLSMKKASSSARNQERNVYQSLEPLYFFTVVVGLSPYMYYREYKPSKILLIYSVLVIASFLGFYATLVHRQRILTGPSITSTIDVLHVYYNNIFFTILIVFACKEHRQLINAVKRLSFMDNIFKQLGFTVTLTYNTTRWSLTAYLLSLFVVTGLLEAANCSYTLRERFLYSRYCLAYCYFIVFTTALVECQFVTFATLLKQRFAELNRYLTDLRPQLLQPRNLVKDIQTCHRELCEVLTDVNNVFSLQLLISVGLIFFESTLNLIHAFQRIKANDLDWDTWTTFLWAGFFMFRLFIISYVCETTVDEAANTGSLLHNIQVHYDDEETIDTILMFSKQMLHNKLQLSAYGFFSLDMSLFFSIIAAVAMYLLILIQMDVFSRDDFDNRTTLAAGLLNVWFNDSYEY